MTIKKETLADIFTTMNESAREYDRIKELVNLIFENNLKIARHPEDGSLLSPELLLQAMKNAIKEAYEIGVKEGISHGENDRERYLNQVKECVG